MVSFGLQIQPQARMVSIVRRFIEESFELLVGDPETVFRISLAVHELLENAAKYSVGGSSGLSVHFESNGSGVTIKLTNQSTPEHIARLRESIEEIQSSEEPIALYHTLMRRTAGIQDESRLGLARIRAEGDLALSLAVDHLTVTIIASRPPTRMHPHG